MWIKLSRKKALKTQNKRVFAKELMQNSYHYTILKYLLPGGIS